MPESAVQALCRTVPIDALICRSWGVVRAAGVAAWSVAESGMTSLEPVLFPVLIDAATDPLVKAVAAYLARYRGSSYLRWVGDDTPSEAGLLR